MTGAFLLSGVWVYRYFQVIFALIKLFPPSRDLNRLLPLRAEYLISITFLSTKKDLKAQFRSYKFVVRFCFYDIQLCS